MLAFASGSAVAGPPEVKPGPDFVGIGIDLSSMKGTVVVYAGAREISGKVAVCGVVFFENPTATIKEVEPKVTSKLIFSLAGKRLQVQPSAFKRYSTEAEALVGNARCSATRTPWSAALGKAKLKIDLERGSISY